MSREAISGTTRARETAANILRETKSPGAEAAFEADLRNSDKNLQVAGALGLAQIGISDGRAILEAAAGDNNSDYQIDSLVALAGLNNPGALRRLTKLLNDSNETVRVRTVWAIARCRMPTLKSLAYRLQLESRPVFCGMLAEKMLDPSNQVDLATRKKILANCRQMDGMIAAATLSKAGLSDLAKNAVSCGLGSADEQVKQLAAILASQYPELQRVVAFKLTDSDPAIQIAALTALERLGRKEEFDTIASYLENKDRAVSSAAAKALACLYPAEAQRIFQQAFASKVDYMRICSAAMLLTLQQRRNVCQPGGSSLRQLQHRFFRLATARDFRN